jgi:hypothetical protein
MELKIDETGQAVIPVLACVLNQLCARNEGLPVQQQHVSKFHALRPPSISISDYLSRIGKYAACSGECFILALVYVDRVIQRNPSFLVNYLNIHRLLITGVMLAAKFFDDQYFNNAYYAKVGGVPTGEINTLEVEFLFMTNFALFVTTEQYAQYYSELANHAMNGSCDCVQHSGGVPDLAIPPLVHDRQLRLPENWRELRESMSRQVFEATAHASPFFVLSVDWSADPAADQESPNPHDFVGQPAQILEGGQPYFGEQEQHQGQGQGGLNQIQEQVDPMGQMQEQTQGQDQQMQMEMDAMEQQQQYHQQQQQQQWDPNQQGF